MASIEHSPALIITLLCRRVLPRSQVSLVCGTNIFLRGVSGLETRDALSYFCETAFVASNQEHPTHLYFVYHVVGKISKRLVKRSDPGYPDIWLQGPQCTVTTRAI